VFAQKQRRASSLAPYGDGFTHNARIVMRWFLNMAERSRLRQNMRPQHAYRRALTTEKRTVLFAPAKFVNEITARFYN
jgi:hypothetical protein